MKNKNKKPSARPVNQSRRDLLRQAGLMGAAVAGSGTLGAPAAAQNHATAESAIPLREALEILTALEADTLEAMVDRILPSDENGPGAKEARAVHFIDRSLAADNKSDRENYGIGLNALNEYAVTTRGRSFHVLNHDQQDSILSAMEANELEGFSPGSAAFFNLVRNDTIDGTFSDPYYGGNRGFVGWDLLRYPGVRLGTTPDEVAKGAALAPSHQSAYDHRTFTKSGGREGV
ncbi:MAG: gluconate 2-dehydrogenase subunit 3 family protein [Pseudohongiellaceae bacterium]